VKRTGVVVIGKVPSKPKTIARGGDEAGEPRNGKRRGRASGAVEEKAEEEEQRGTEGERSS